MGHSLRARETPVAGRRDRNTLSLQKQVLRALKRTLDAVLIWARPLHIYVPQDDHPGRYFTREYPGTIYFVMRL